MRIELNRRLNVFVDETGDFGFEKRSASLYEISLILHEHNDRIDDQVTSLNGKFSTLGFDGILHMGDLVTGHGDYTGMEISERRKIFTTFYAFSKTVNTHYCSVVVEKKNLKTPKELSSRIENKLSVFLTENLNYFQQFDEIVIYYDNGQTQIGKILNKVFSQLSGYRKVSNFNKKEKKLFQVADMMTYLDKLIYKYKNHIKFSKTEARFFSDRDVKTLLREREKKNLR